MADLSDDNSETRILVKNNLANFIPIFYQHIVLEIHMGNVPNNFETRWNFFICQVGKQNFQGFIHCIVFIAHFNLVILVYLVIFVLFEVCECILDQKSLFVCISINWKAWSELWG